MHGIPGEFGQRSNVVGIVVVDADQVVTRPQQAVLRRVRDGIGAASSWTSTTRSAHFGTHSFAPCSLIRLKCMPESSLISATLIPSGIFGFRFCDLSSTTTSKNGVGAPPASSSSDSSSDWASSFSILVGLLRFRGLVLAVVLAVWRIRRESFSAASRRLRSFAFSTASCDATRRW